MKAIIYLSGLPSDEFEVVETFKGTEAELRNRLRKFQLKYSVDKHPIISQWTSEKGQRYIEAISESDFNYVAQIIES